MAGRTITSVERTLKIVATLRRLDGATVTALSDRVGLAPGTVHTHLTTLKEHGLVVQSGQTYRLGPQLLTLGEYVRHHEPLYHAGKKVVDELAVDLGECVHLFVENRLETIIVYEAFGDDAVGREYHARARETSMHHLHQQASGKAVLAALSPERLDRYLETCEFEARTVNSITSPDELLAELETVRDRGYAVNDEEEVIGIRAVGVPLSADDGEPLGALSLSATKSRLQGDRLTQQLPDLLRDAANVIEVNLRTSGVDPARTP